MPLSVAALGLEVPPMLLVTSGSQQTTRWRISVAGDAFEDAVDVAGGAN